MEYVEFEPVAWHARPQASGQPARPQASGPQASGPQAPAPEPSPWPPGPPGPGLALISPPTNRCTGSD